LVYQNVRKFSHEVVDHVQTILGILGIDKSSILVLKKAEAPARTIIQSILEGRADFAQNKDRSAIGVHARMTQE
jgi:hypothetical protein